MILIFGYVKYKFIYLIVFNNVNFYFFKKYIMFINLLYIGNGIGFCY